MAEHWCRGDYEAALRVALTDPNPHDESSDRKEKQLLADHWNRWHELPRLRDPVRHAVVAHLAARPGDFRRAIIRIPHSLRSLHLSAFQSAVWNQMLATEVARRLGAERCFGGEIAPGIVILLPTREEPAGFLAETSLPLPSARQKLPEDWTPDATAALLAKYNLEYRQLRVKYPRDTFFSKGERAAGFQPTALHGDVADDERYPSRKKWILAFDLLRGCYATMFLRRLAAALE
jgi:tRNA pseudouridine13 synthase